jgi:MerR family transcriptional regulator, light-induced transcriptional regulator
MPASYPISAVAKLTGLPLDTLRAWERRYGAVTPMRSPRGRIYSAEQIKRLILLRQAVEQGHAIGQVAGLGDRQLRELHDKSSSFATVRSGSTARESQDILIPVLRALERFDYAATDREINRLAATIPSPRDFVHQVALPLMNTIGGRWHEGKCSIAQEHILTRHLSALMLSLVRTYSRSNPPARVLLATPRNERHEFPILAAAMLTAVVGLGVIYVGADLPAADIVLAARRTDANAVLLSLSAAPSSETVEELSHIARKLPRSTALWLGGPPDLGLERAVAGSRWLVLRDFCVLEDQLGALGRRF